MKIQLYSEDWKQKIGIPPYNYPFDLRENDTIRWNNREYYVAQVRHNLDNQTLEVMTDPLEPALR